MDLIRTAACAFCGAEFIISARQEKRLKYESGHKVYCSRTCQAAQMSRERRRPRPFYGPCPTCGKMFQSRTPKKYCSLQCYVSSPAMRLMLSSNRAKMGHMPQKKKAPVPCLNCGKMMDPGKPSRRKKHCSTLCYREYMAARYDRWMANPDTIRLPQAFDEFLSGSELRCLIDSCGWRGKHLSMHVNLAHGIPTREFKRAAGFNMSSGLVSSDLHQKLCASNAGKGSSPEILKSMRQMRDPIPGDVVRYRSLEAAEHSVKGQQEALSQPGPARTCKGCGVTFIQASPMGCKLYCTIACRTDHYVRNKRVRAGSPAFCGVCGRAFLLNYGQRLRASRGAIVVCCFSCRQKRSGMIARGTWPGDDEWRNSRLAGKMPLKRGGRAAMNSYDDQAPCGA